MIMIITVATALQAWNYMEDMAPVALVLASVAQVLCLGAPILIDFKTFQWKCPLPKKKNGLALSKIQFQACIERNVTLEKMVTARSFFLFRWDLEAVGFYWQRTGFFPALRCFQPAFNSIEVVVVFSQIQFAPIKYDFSW